MQCGDAINLRLDFATGRDRLGLRFTGPSDRDMVIEVGDGMEQQIAWHAGQWMTSHPLSVDIRRGNVQDYPFDRYTALDDGSVRKCRSCERHDGPIANNRVEASSRLGHNNQCDTATVGPRHDHTDFRRTACRPSHLFATTIYCAMAVMAIIALSVGSLLYLGVRRMDTTMAAVLARRAGLTFRRKVTGSKRLRLVLT